MLAASSEEDDELEAEMRVVDVDELETALTMPHPIVVTGITHSLLRVTAR
jgi:hypothetical protein